MLGVVLKSKWIAILLIGGAGILAWQQLRMRNLSVQNSHLIARLDATAGWSEERARLLEQGSQSSRLAEEVTVLHGELNAVRSELIEARTMVESAGEEFLPTLERDLDGNLDPAELDSALKEARKDVLKRRLKLEELELLRAENSGDISEAMAEARRELLHGEYNLRELEIELEDAVSSGAMSREAAETEYHEVELDVAAQRFEVEQHELADAVERGDLTPEIAAAQETVLLAELDHKGEEARLRRALSQGELTRESAESVLRQSEVTVRESQLAVERLEIDQAVREGELSEEVATLRKAQMRSEYELELLELDAGP